MRTFYRNLIAIVALGAAACGGGEGTTDTGNNAGASGGGGAGQAGASGSSGQSGGGGDSGGSGQAGSAGVSGSSGQGGGASGSSGQGGSGGDSGSSGQAGAAGEAGAAGAGAGGSGGGGAGGDAGAGGSSGTSGQGGQGGGGPGCCAQNSDCVGEEPVFLVCVAGQCKLPAGPEQCWGQADCKEGFTCEGAILCPCGEVCPAIPDSPGKCVPGGEACCKQDDECKKQGLSRCIKGVCREELQVGQCWDGGDCGSSQSCEGSAPCGCGLLCAQDSPGKCVDGPAPGCCKADGDCKQGESCINQICKKPAPAGQCWQGDDCKAGQVCEGAMICPCGAQCFAQDKPGQCVDGPSPGSCCQKDADCGQKEQCVLSGALGASKGMCKPVLSDGSCWDQSDCKAGQKCADPFVCPCGAECLLPDKPGKCQ
jgi:hypothetical protein